MSSTAAQKKIQNTYRYGKRFTSVVLEQETKDIIDHYNKVYGISVTKFLNDCIRQFDFRSKVNADFTVTRTEIRKKVAKWIKPMIDSPLSQEETIDLLTDKYFEILVLSAKSDNAHTSKARIRNHS